MRARPRRSPGHDAPPPGEDGAGAERERYGLPREEERLRAGMAEGVQRREADDGAEVDAREDVERLK